MKKNSERVLWMDCAKGVAMLAVLIDHLRWVVYQREDIQIGTLFSVPLFVFISGMNAYASCAKTETLDIRKTLKRVWRILAPYLVAVLLYLIARESFVDVRTYLSHAIQFNIAGHHYFVLFFTQLLLVAPILVRLIQKGKALPGWKTVLAQILIIAGAIFLAYLTMNYTYVLKVYGGGKYLLGGTFLVIFLWGMQAASYDLFRFRWLRSVVTFLVSAVLWVIWWRIISVHQVKIDESIPFGPGDPPSISLTVLAFLMLIVVYSGTAFLQKISWLSFLPKAFAWMGRHSLYIFLYHVLIWDQLVNRFMAPIIKPFYDTWDPHIQLIYRLAAAIFGSVAIEYLFKRIKKWIVENKPQPVPNNQ